MYSVIFDSPVVQCITRKQSWYISWCFKQDCVFIYKHSLYFPLHPVKNPAVFQVNTAANQKFCCWLSTECNGWLFRQDPGKEAQGRRSSMSCWEVIVIHQLAWARAVFLQRFINYVRAVPGSHLQQKKMNMGVMKVL